MARVMRRVVGMLLVLVLVLAVGTIGLVGAIAGGAHPQTAGSLRVPGLDAPVRVVRDVYGVAQITASSPRDLFLAQGYVHAQDRFWQMEVWRHIGAGRLSELFGKSQVETDRLIRVLGWRQAAERDWTVLSADAQAALQAYAEGVNAFLDARRGRLGLAVTITGLQSGAGDGLAGYVPEPWTPIDTLAWAKVQAWDLGGNLDSELFRMLVDRRLGDAARTDELFPPYDPLGAVIAAPETTAPGGSTGGAPSGREDGTTTPVPGPIDASAAWAELGRRANAIPAIAGLAPERGLVDDGGVGSNNWVVAPSRSSTGTALLANDPHLGLSMPSIWYLNGLHCAPRTEACPYDVVGASFPGSPAVVLGRNDRIAWGATNANPDVQDLVIERVDPADPSRYLTATGSVPFETRTETIRVAGGSDVTLVVRETVHGPILNDGDARLADAGDLLALRWTALVEPDPIVDGFLALNRARDWDGFRDALRRLHAPAQNFVYADVDGHIGYQLPGLIPIRTDPDDRGDRPVPGWDGQHEWVGFVPFDELPSVLDPASGRIVTANNPIFETGAFIGQEYDRGDRAARILELLDEAGNGISQDSMAAMQLDTRLRRADRLVPGLLDLAPAPATSDGRLVLDRIRAWDRSCELPSTGCPAYVVLEYLLQRAVFDDELGPQARDYAGSGEAQDLLAMLLSPDGRGAAWWDDVDTPGRETARGVVEAALDRAGAMLRADLGSPRRWTWDRLHRATFREPTLGSSGIGPLEWIFDHGPIPVAGAAGAVNNTSYRVSRGYVDPIHPDRPAATDLRVIFSVTNGPSVRLLVDMGDLDGARAVTTTGQSGHPFARNVDDLARRWAGGSTIPLPTSAEAIERAAAAILVLEPDR